MTYMNSIGPDEIARRKTKSDFINDTDALIFVNKENNKQSRAYQKVRDLKDKLELATLIKGEL